MLDTTMQEATMDQTNSLERLTEISSAGAISVALVATMGPNGPFISAPNPITVGGSEMGTKPNDMTWKVTWTIEAGPGSGILPEDFKSLVVDLSCWPSGVTILDLTSHPTVFTATIRNQVSQKSSFSYTIFADITVAKIHTDPTVEDPTIVVTPDPIT